MAIRIIELIRSQAVNLNWAVVLIASHLQSMLCLHVRLWYSGRVGGYRIGQGSTSLHCEVPSGRVCNSSGALSIGWELVASGFMPRETSPGPSPSSGICRFRSACVDLFQSIFMNLDRCSFSAEIIMQAKANPVGLKYGSQTYLHIIMYICWPKEQHISEFWSIQNIWKHQDDTAVHEMQPVCTRLPRREL